VLIVGFAACGQAAETISHPFAGIIHIVRSETEPRPLAMHVVLIDLKTAGLRFHLTPHRGPQDTIKQTTLAFLAEQKAQLAINAHFFEPWPPPSPDPGAADLVGLAACDGQVYSPFEADPPKPQAIRSNAPAINIDPDNSASIVHRNLADPTGRTVIEPVRLWTALAGNEQILTAGVITAGTGSWDSMPNPRTVVGLAPGRLVLLVVDGRQPGRSEGLNTREAAAILKNDYGVTDAINLDGGGSTALCLADPTPRIVNRPVGQKDAPGTLRPVGSSLVVFAGPIVDAGRGTADGCLVALGARSDHPCGRHCRDDSRTAQGAVDTEAARQADKLGAD
jgi:hypothetical protein